MTNITDETVHGAEVHTRGIQVTVNNHTVTLTERTLTGLQIKQAAIAQGAAVELGFQLSAKQGKRYKVIGDNDAVTVHEHQEFLAVAPDDNS
jgi:hypothetical protein